MVFPHFLLVWLLLETVCRASALHVGVRGEPRSSFTAKRDHISGLENGRNLDYLVNVTVGGQPFQVLIDTGR
jgi:predicted aspartyl protease